MLAQTLENSIEGKVQHVVRSARDRLESRLVRRSCDARLAHPTTGSTVACTEPQQRAG
jgi:hypothetical protein